MNGTKGTKAKANGIGVGEMYRALMAEKGLTQTEVAELVGVNQSSVASFMIKGNPSLSVLYRYLLPLGYEVCVKPVDAETPDGFLGIVPSGPTGPELNRYGFSGGKYIEDPEEAADNAWNYMLRRYAFGRVELHGRSVGVWIRRDAKPCDNGYLVTRGDFDGSRVRRADFIPMTDVENYGWKRFKA